MKYKVLVLLATFASYLLSGLISTNKSFSLISDSMAETANECCPIWDVTVTYEGFNKTITCTTGGDYQCLDCDCDS